MDYFELPKIDIANELYIWDYKQRELINFHLLTNRTRVPELQKGENFLFKGHFIPDEFLQLKSVPTDDVADRLNQTSRETGYGIMVVDPALNSRLTGHLPVIDITNDKFYVDLRLYEFRATDDFMCVLSMDDFESTENDETLTFFYNKATRSVEWIDASITKFPENVVLAEIPNELGLDPVVASRTLHGVDTYLLREFPIPKSLEAKITPLEKTYVKEIIAENLLKEQQGKESNMNKGIGR